MGLFYLPTQANFVFVDVKRDSREVFQALLREGVIVRTGDIFGCPTFLRVSIGTMEQNERFIRALKKVLGGAD
jgi:histidinol-phosphate aminotransferase